MPRRRRDRAGAPLGAGLDVDARGDVRASCGGAGRGSGEVDRFAAIDRGRRAAALRTPGSIAGRTRDIVRTGAMRLDELIALELSDTDASVATVNNGTYVPTEIATDLGFWRVVGLYLAEG